ncbi:surface-adhesin E family protein [Acinetobacter baumannii]|uniref:surface-adhesin E family protein n=1 Tax=Acinetobacter genomosp. 33YU TaxID=1675530 RepID=UPI00097F7C4E|nr:surface-adhesin E family protein [Acinetobacter genomosp. 33YU]
MFKFFLILGLGLSSFSVLGNSNTLETWDDLKNNYINAEEDTKTQIKRAAASKGWVSVSKSNEFQAFVNFNHVEQITNEIVQAWVKNVVINDVTKDGLNIGDYSMYLVRYDCSNKTYKNISYTDYKAKTGTVLDSYTFTNTNFKPIIPESVGESQFDLICFFNFIKNN